MPKRFPLLFLLVVLAVGAIIYLFEIRVENGKDGFRLRFASRKHTSDWLPTFNSSEEPEADLAPLRMGSFNLTHLESSDLKDPQLTGQLVAVVQEYDIIALQGFYGSDENALLLLRDALEKEEPGEWGCLAPPFRNPLREPLYGATFYRKSRVEIGCGTEHRLEPELRPTGPESNDGPSYSRMRVAPFLAMFRAKNVDPASALTFKFVNFQLCADERQYAEVLLEQIYTIAEKQTTPNNEDDIILAGSLGLEPNVVVPLAEQVGLYSCFGMESLHLTHLSQTDHLLVKSAATREYLQRNEVLDIPQFIASPPSAKAGPSQSSALTFSSGLANLTESRPILGYFSLHESGLHIEVEVAEQETPPRR